MSGDWSMLDREWSRCLAEAGYAAGPGRRYEPAPLPTGRCGPCDRYYYPGAPAYDQNYLARPMPPPTASLLASSPYRTAPGSVEPSVSALPRGENPREIRNKAEKQRRDKLNQSIAELASMVPPVMAASRRIDKTGVLRLTAHYLRAHQYVFGESINQQRDPEINSSMALSLLHLMNGFLITVTYKGLVVVVSQNVTQYLGYNELDLLGLSIMNIIHEEDRKILKDNLMPETVMLGPNGELLFPDDPDGKQKVGEALAKEKRRFVIRFKKLTQRSEPPQYVTCYVEGSLRKADRACRGYTRCCQMVRRVRARGENPCSSGNDIVFIGVVRPSMETFLKEKAIEAFRMDYRTRHSVDGEIIQCEQKISLVTGYMIHEVYGLNAMNFMHRDDVRWVIIVLRNMYDQNRLMGESCYRLMMKNGNFVYMRTRGCLEVDQGSGAVTTFVCTNSVVDEQEGKHLIAMMKKKFMVLVNNNKDPLAPSIKNLIEPNHDEKPGQETIEDPRRLEKVILHLVTNLPSPEPRVDCPPNDRSNQRRLSIIPPRKERIVSTIDKIYTLIKSLDRNKTPAKVTEITESPKASSENKDSESEIYSSSSENGNRTKLEPFERTFLKRNVCDNNDQIVSKISDHVLAAVQLSDRDASTSLGGPVKRPSEQNDDNLRFSYKRKTRDITPYVPYGDCETKIINEVYDSTCLDSLLDENGLDAFGLIQVMDNNSSEENQDPITDLLLESDFEELFASVETNQLDAGAGLKDSPF